MIEIRYTNGATQMVDTLKDAIDIITALEADAVFYDQHGFAYRWTEEEVQCGMLEEDARILAWRCEEESINDDGAKAIASLRLA
jgi:hypothetical protein